VILKSCIQQGLQGCPASFLLLLMASGSCVVAILLPLLLLCSYLTSALCSVSTLQKKQVSPSRSMAGRGIHISFLLKAPAEHLAHNTCSVNAP
jgi:hypothetical protein